MDPPAHAQPFPHARALRSRRLLLGVPLTAPARDSHELLAETSLDPHVLERQLGLSL